MLWIVDAATEKRGVAASAVPNQTRVENPPRNQKQTVVPPNWTSHLKPSAANASGPTYTKGALSDGLSLRLDAAGCSPRFQGFETDFKMGVFLICSIPGASPDPALLFKRLRE